MNYNKPLSMLIKSFILTAIFFLNGVFLGRVVGAVVGLLIGIVISWLVVRYDKCRTS
ncbi:MAG: hypothetical protein AB1489_09615 [Acidobacteriota bacterium]